MGKYVNGNASPALFKNAQDLRKSSTEAEALLWKYLRNQKFMGLKFRRQHPVNDFILDFYCYEKKLGIEVDGSIHDEEYIARYDEFRTRELKEQGIQIIRFRNEEILGGIDGVLGRLRYCLIPGPSPDNSGEGSATS